MLPDKKPIYTYTHSLRSRYAETDRMGYVYYGRYLEYFEVARTEMIRALNMPYRELEDQGIMLPVVQTRVDYKKPIYYDELMQVSVHLYDLPSVKLETYYEISTRENSTPNAFGKVVLCFMKRNSRKPCRAPSRFIDGLKAEVE